MPHYNYRDLCLRALVYEVLDDPDDEFVSHVAHTFFSQGGVIITRDLLYPSQFVCISINDAKINADGDLEVVSDRHRSLTGDLIPWANYVHLYVDQSRVGEVPWLLADWKWEDEENVILWMDEWEGASEKLWQWILKTEPK